MSYEIARSDKQIGDALPPQTFGFEEIDVLERGAFGRPKRMEGRMYHACVPGTSLYRGRSVYRRINREEYTSLLKKLRPDKMINNKKLDLKNDSSN